MLKPIDVSEVIEAAASLGITMGVDEANIYLGAITRQLDSFNQLFESQVHEDRLGTVTTSRDPGYRPSAEEDPYNAWIWRCRIEGASDGPLKGKTVGLKDHIPVASLPLTFGSFLMQDFVADFDAPIVTRLLNGGATIVGKVNMDNFSCGGAGFDGVTDFGRVLNPYIQDHITGGSSSGAAVAVATDQCDIAIGGDQGGSVRIPAAWCGVIGLKPTAGLVPHTGIMGSDPSLDRVGPLAKSVSDIATTLQVIAGGDGYDFRQLTAPSMYDATTQLDRGVNRLRVGVLEEGIAEPIEGDVRESFLAAVETLRTLGAEVVTLSVPEHRAALAPYIVLSAEGSRLQFDTRFIQGASRFYPQHLITELDRAVRSDADRLPHLLKLRYLVAEFSRQTMHGAAYAKAHNARKAFIEAYDEALSKVDVLLMPTMTFKPPKHVPSADPLDAVKRTLGVYGFGPYSTVQNTAPFNYTGHPALSMPCGISQGLPVALQIVGRYFDEATILRVASAYESAGRSRVQS
jgi:amidase